MSNNSWAVIVPFLDEMENVQELLRHLLEVCPTADLIFVDGGSRDGCDRYLEEKGQRVLHCKASRGAQIDLGINCSENPYILVHHADSRLPENCAELFEKMKNILMSPGVSGGAFTFKIDHSDKKYRRKEKDVMMRSRTLQMPYGDQGQFFTREFYEEMGGVASYEVMEDVQLHNEMRLRGRIVIMNDEVKTSARRFEKQGAFYANIRNILMLYLFHIGLSTKTLKKLYGFRGSGKIKFNPDAEKLNPETMKVRVVIPALNEEISVPLVLAEIPQDKVEEVILVDNGSSDNTAQVAKEAGATVLHEKQKGYGAACLKGISALPEDTDVVVFVDADYSDHPADMLLLLDKIVEGYDMVIGSRKLGRAEAGALLPQARFGNALACFLIHLFFAHKYSDLGPFRAIRMKALKEIEMADEAFGWTVEMQVKALIKKMSVTEVSVAYKKRVGVSKITGTIEGSFKAGITILRVIFQAGLRRKL